MRANSYTTYLVRQCLRRQVIRLGLTDKCLVCIVLEGIDHKHLLEEEEAKKGSFFCVRSKRQKNRKTEGGERQKKKKKKKKTE